MLLNIFVLQLYFVLPCFLDNINTLSAIDTMHELVSDVYIFLEKQKVPNREVLKIIAVYITYIFPLHRAGLNLKTPN